MLILVDGSPSLRLHDKFCQHELHGGRDVLLDARGLETLGGMKNAPAVIRLVVELLLAEVDQRDHLTRQHLTCIVARNNTKC